MMSAGDMACESCQKRVPRLQFKSKATALGQKVIDPCL
jgi:hypothetical protein